MSSRFPVCNVFLSPQSQANEFSGGQHEFHNHTMRSEEHGDAGSDHDVRDVRDVRDVHDVRDVRDDHGDHGNCF